MTEHWFMALMLFLVALECLAALVIVYKVYRKSDQIEGITAAIYLEARKILSQLR